MSHAHPKNQTRVHDIILSDKDSSKDFTGLLKPEMLARQLNKTMKVVKAFRKPDIKYNPMKAPDDDIYYTTYRSGFVSTLAMSYNFHLPLILSPTDIWLTVLQGFRVHMNKNKDKAFF
mmetsp:Transcript_13942/g.21737  ORF Transcript_13942/g.21737 Transcript_13942/m.21737 type:complete len:118 (-) Transcript_13942:980-1333(-)